MMKLAAAFTLFFLLCCLPSSLSLYSSRAVELTWNSFDSEVETGLWFIQFTSPYCGHCRRFAPEWDKFIAVVQDDFGSLDVQFAEVDCSKYGGLCDWESIKGYPTLRLYRDGRTVDQFKGPREVGLLLDFLKSNLVGTATDYNDWNALTQTYGSVKVSPNSLADVTGQGSWVVKYCFAQSKECQRLEPKWRILVDSPPEVPGLRYAELDCELHDDFCQDISTPRADYYVDGQLQQIWPLRRLPFFKPNPFGKVLELSDSEVFHETADDGPMIVKFSAPGCRGCKRFPPSLWDTIARDMKEEITVAEVDCEVHENICQSEQVDVYPSVFFYDGMSRVEFTGQRTYQPLVDFVKEQKSSAELKVEQPKTEVVGADDVTQEILDSD
ncbi:hypothetical protein VKT23_010102 [Stygiomarasmius scandens]|uniref:Thioredoxin domain-containing protein n=1 Tax=Marasmiellus scandens TaxID=2682957 RepID=A0ABR1JHA6_9AGAR